MLGAAGSAQPTTLPNVEQSTLPTTLPTLPKVEQSGGSTTVPQPQVLSRPSGQWGPNPLGNRKLQRQMQKQQAVPAEEPAVTNDSTQAVRDNSTDDTTLGSTRVETGCLFVPGKLESKMVTYLLDTGCSHSIVSKTVFN